MIQIDRRDGIPVVRLDRAEQHNALVPELLATLREALLEAAADERPIVLSGSGRTFCTGADLRWLGAHSDIALGVAELVATHHAVIGAMLDLRVPIVAAINGATAGGGLGLALAADYRVAGASASFTAAYFRLGLTPDGGSSALLERTIGAARALELLLTNRRLGAAEACAWGLVNEVAPDDALLDRAVAVAQSLLPVPGYALLVTRQLLDVVGLKRQLQLEKVAICAAARGDYFRTALQNFLAAHKNK